MTVVRVYSKANCQQCVATFRKMDSLGMAYVVEDALDPGNLEAVKALGFLSAPVVVAGVSGDDMWSGYRPDRIIELAARIGGK